MSSPSSISPVEFKDALSRYPDLIKTMTKSPKPGSLTLDELDRFRYVEAPARFSKKTGRTMELVDIQKLVEWKIRHGTYRPTLPKLVASNSNERIEETTKDAFSHYAKSPSDITTVLKKLYEPLKGIGPATASLLLAIHDPDHVIFFSDEAYRWLCADGKKASPKYTVKEFDELFGKAKTLMTKLRVNPIDVEKVAFVLIKENEPVYEPKPKKEPSGLPRGRPSKPDSEKKAKKPTVPGRGRGRPPKTVNGVALKTPKPPKEAKKKRGRPFGMRGVVVEEKEEEKKEEEKKKDDDEGGDKEEEVTPAPKSAKRKATETPKDTPAKRTRKSNA